MVKYYKYYLKKILLDVLFILKHVDNVTFEQFSSNELLIDSVCFRVIQISELSDKVSMNFKTKNSSIPWRVLKGFRNRIVHDYSNIDYKIVYDTATIDLISIKEFIESVV